MTKPLLHSLQEEGKQFNEKVKMLPLYLFEVKRTTKETIQPPAEQDNRTLACMGPLGSISK